MKCDTCKFKELYIGSGGPDDYSVEYCSKRHWEGGEYQEEDEATGYWDNCADYEAESLPIIKQG